MIPASRLSWPGILRLGLVQMSLGAIAVLSLSTLNRIMVVELALPAILPGLLVGLHYAVQLLRPRWGYGSDKGGRRTPWIVGGMAVLALGGAGACAATALMTQMPALGIFAAVLAYLAIGLGAGAAGTSLLALLAKEAGPTRGPIAGPIVWIMMILGFALSAGLSGKFLDPFSASRLMAVGATVSAIAFLIAVLAVWGVESQEIKPSFSQQTPNFFAALRAVWAEPQAQRLSIFIFVSMLAFSGQELLLEPFGGTVFRLTPGQTAQLSGLLHGGAFLGMISGLATAAFAARAGLKSLGPVISAGCAGSAIGLLSMVYGGTIGPDWPIRISVGALGFANGIYAIASVAAMMALAGTASRTSTGTHLGVWGAAQGVASGLGGVMGTAAADLMRTATGSAYTAYLTIFTAEAALFLFAAWLAIGIGKLPQRMNATRATANGAAASAAAQ